MLHRNNRYFKWGLTAFLVLAAVVVFWVIFSNLSGFYNLILEFLGIISSLLYGCVFAYLMNPILGISQRLFRRILRKCKWKEKTKFLTEQVCAVTVTVLVFLAVVYALIAMIVPSIADSVMELIRPERVQDYYSTVMQWAHSVFAGTPIGLWIEENFAEVLDVVANYLKKLDFMALLSGAASSVYNVVTAVSNMLIGIIAGVYILVYKKELCAQAKKLTVALFRTERADRIFTVARRTNRIFSGYVIGKIIDAAFVGVVTYFALLIMGMPFAPLIAVLVGVTNIIPFFGPFIGAIPSALLLLIDDPINAVYFGIFIVILQMIDGNIIENRILGEKLGISDFWVLVSILISGGVFGFGGMLLGVPIFAVIYTLITDTVNKKLRKKRLPTDTELYTGIATVTDLPTGGRSLAPMEGEPNYDRNAVEEEQLEED
ncbi:MAG: AI-2E family transporter [Oscillospiraceae bacterium]|nr:AI-2E family transporter [Oscillospiraceae bacterium]